MSEVRDIDQMTDEDLLPLIQHDPDALEALYRRHVFRTVKFAVRRCDSPEQVHDLVAATWLELITASSRFDPDRGRAVPWILGVMANLANDRRRRHAREREALKRLSGRRVLSPDDATRLEEAIDAARLAGSVVEELARMPAHDREAIELIAFAHLTQDEAACALGIEVTAFRMRLSRARSRLRSATESTSDPEVIER